MNNMNNQNDQNNMNPQNGYPQDYGQQGGYPQNDYNGYPQNSYQQGYGQQDPQYTNYYQEQDGTSNYVNMYSDPERPAKKSGGKTFLKVVAAVAALAIVSVSSVELYKLFGKDSRTANWTSSASSEQSQDADKATEAATEAAKTAEKNGPEASTAVGGGSKSAWINMAAPADALTIPEIVNKALPSVVGISSTFEAQTSDIGSYWGFNFYGGGGYGGQKQQFTATGTGIIMSEDGYVITNAHCIYDNESQYKAGKAISVSVVMGDENETEYEAQVVGYDIQTDLAVLKIDATGLTPAEFGNSDDLQVGEMVVAIGNPLGFELFGTTTCGIVSALNRNVTIEDREMTLIQTDAAINSGNSGGPLLNGYGQVIGINSAKMSNNYSSASVEGLGFAIPISSAKDIINDLIGSGYVTGRPQLGISGADVTEADAQRFNIPQGVYVLNVAEDSAAAAAGLRQGDIITEIEGQTITSMDELNEIKNQHNAGETISLKVYRSGEFYETELTLQEVQAED